MNHNGRLFRLPLLALWSAAVAASAQAAIVPGDYAIQINENGGSQIVGPGESAGELDSNVTPPPLPSTFVLTYYLPVDWEPVAGDVGLREGLGELSDLIRFNPASEGTRASIEFYSDRGDSVISLADEAGWPDAFYVNSLSILEIGGSASYNPAPGQPGYVSGLNTTYTFISDIPAVPEPPTWAMMLLGFGAIGGMLRGAHRRYPAPPPLCPETV